MALPWKVLLTAAMIFSAVEARKEIEGPVTPDVSEVSVTPYLTNETAQIEAENIRTVVDCAHWAVAVTQTDRSAYFGNAGATGLSLGFFLSWANPDQSWCTNMTESLNSGGFSGGVEARSIDFDSGESLFAVYFWKIKGTEFVNSSPSKVQAALAAAGTKAISIDPLDAQSIAEEVIEIASLPDDAPLAAVSSATSSATKSLAIANPDKLPLARVEVGDKVTLLALPI